MYYDTKYKRLERGMFHFPAAGQASIAVTSAELMGLLAGPAGATE